MKVVVLGAAGRLGRRMVWRLVEGGLCEHIFAADEDAQGVNNLVGDLAGARVSARYMDAADPSSIEERMREADVSLGFVGPFHRHEEAMVRAAIHTGTHYISACNDPAGTQAALGRAGEAAQAGAVIGTGFGWSPGLSNLLALHAATGLSAVRSVRIFWAEQGLGYGLGSLLHYAECLAGRAPVRRGGASDEVSAGSWEEWVYLPGPLRRAAAVFTSHPEPLTLPHRLAGVEELYVKGGFASQGANLFMRTLAWSLQNVQPGTRDIVCASCRGALRRLGWAGDEPWPAALRVEVRGLGQKGDVSCVVGASGSCVEGVAGLMALALRRMAAGELSPGVYPPEELLEPREAFRELESRGVQLWLQD